MRELDTLRVMTPVELKTLEGQKILPLLGAVAALPGAGLVYSDPAGAPFFSAALACVAAAYLFWMLTDAFYYQQLMISGTRHNRLARRPLEKAAIGHQRCMVGYTIAATLLTLAGFAGVHGDLRMPLTVGQGFLALMPVLVPILVHGVIANEARSRVFLRVRTIRERSLRQAAFG